MTDLEKELFELETINTARVQAYEKTLEEIEEHRLLTYKIELIINSLIERDNQMYEEAVERTKELLGNKND